MIVVYKMYIRNTFLELIKCKVKFMLQYWDKIEHVAFTNFNHQRPFRLHMHTKLVIKENNFELALQQYNLKSCTVNGVLNSIFHIKSVSTAIQIAPGTIKQTFRAI